MSGSTNDSTDNYNQLRRQKSRLRQKRFKDKHGFSGKTTWDWLQLLFIPVMLAIVAFGLNWAEQGRTDATEANRISEQRAIETDRIQEQNLQDYFDDMAGLLLREENNLRDAEKGNEARIIARARTLAVLRTLDSNRKGLLLLFLYEAELIQTINTVINLNDANLNEANLFLADLTRANLSGADLSWADLYGAKLCDANLSGVHLFEAKLSEADLSGANLSIAKLWDADLTAANLSGADLTRAALRGADLRRANLRGAIIANEELKDVRSLEGATMPDGKFYDPEIHGELGQDRIGEQGQEE